MGTDFDFTDSDDEIDEMDMFGPAVDLDCDELEISDDEYERLIKSGVIHLD